MTLSFRNLAFWRSCPLFVEKSIDMSYLGIKLLGYFPYHTAKINPEEVSHGIYAPITALPRSVFKHIERIFDLYHITDNKAVYIFSVDDDSPGNVVFNFALMFKDNYVIIGTWGNVVNWHGNAINTR
jgi:hypothetical protein